MFAQMKKCTERSHVWDVDGTNPFDGFTWNV